MATAKPMRVFVDSDVVISSLLSKSGAAYSLLCNTKQIELYISNFSSIELERVIGRLQIEPKALHTLAATRLKLIKIDLPYEKVQEQYADYVRDPHDAHIVAGTKEAKAAFLVTYNARHFIPARLRQDFKLNVLTPGLFLQYLRSL